MRVPLIAAFSCFLLTGCVPYRDFTLPESPELSRQVAYTWEPSSFPVIPRGAAGEWDSVDVLNPSVVRFQNAYWNFYSGFDGNTWRTGLALSDDGQSWHKQGMVLTPDAATWEGTSMAANGSAVVRNGKIYYWYQTGNPHRIALACSIDGRHWQKRSQPVLKPGPFGSWDERAVADPYVIEAGTALYMFYLGMDRAHRQRLGIATSEDGAHWWKLRSNPILELGWRNNFDERGLGEPAVWTAQGHYWMLYTGRDRQEVRRLGLAKSRNGAQWEKMPAPIIGGGQAWNAKVICDPTIEMVNAGVRVWFGGGDVAHPVENIHGQIGIGMLRLNP